MAGQLFLNGRLTLQQLRCEEIHPPFVFKRVGPAPDVLVVENHHTYVSLCRVLPRGSEVGIVVYGAGAHFKGSVTYLADLPRRRVAFSTSAISTSTAWTSRHARAPLRKLPTFPRSSPRLSSTGCC